MMDRDVHARFLKYREAFAYFALAAQGPLLDAVAFEVADREQRALEQKGAGRNDEEEARFVALTIALFRD
jgi:hypothetical protein